MSKKRMILASLSLLIVLVPFTGAWAFSQYWDFSSGLDTSMFSVDGPSEPGHTFTLNDTGGNLLFSKPATGPPASPPNYFWAGIVSKFYLQGNFSIKVNYNLESALNSGDMIQLGMDDQTALHSGVSLYRSVYTPLPGSIYGVGKGDDVSGFTDLYHTTTTDTYGTFQLQRTGSSVSASVIHDATTTPLYTVSDFGTLDVAFYFTVQQFEGNNFGPLAVSFDDLYVNADHIVPLPGAFWLFGSGLLGLAGWRQFKKG